MEAIILKAKIKGVTLTEEEVKVEDLKKNIKCYCWLQNLTKVKAPSGEFTDDASIKAKSEIVIPKSAVGTTLFFEVEQYVISGEYGASTYYKIKSIVKGL